MLCQICCYNDATIIFDDSTYAPSKKYPNSFYNVIINPSCFNVIDICYICLIEHVYKCDMELKYNLLQELLYFNNIKKIQQWWINKIYNIDTKIGSCFIYKNISDITKRILIKNN